MSVSTQLAVSPVESEPRSPWIPPELISLILIRFWEAPLSSDERSASLQNIVLVNRTWLSLIAPIACRDVHLFNHGNANNFITSLQNFDYHKDLFTTEANRIVHETCRSITVHANGNPQRADLFNATPAFWDPKSFGINQAIHCAMDGVHERKSLPNLRHVSLRYTDWVYDDIILQAEYAPFPRQVTHLSVNYYCFSASIRRLTLSGMPVGLMVIMLQLVCPKVETLELAHPAQLSALAPLPPTMRTLVLCYPGIAVCKETMASWGLDAALDVGLFPKGSDSEPRRIIVRSGTPDPATFAELKRTCQHEFGVELAYERDDSRSHVRACQHERKYSVDF
ncbi:hypothetical protein V8D89_000432 [Ganoderma adspersum]